jgi:hypothetical protein
VTPKIQPVEPKDSVKNLKIKNVIFRLRLWKAEYCFEPEAGHIPTKQILPFNGLLSDMSPNLGPLISRWEVGKFTTLKIADIKVSGL